MQSCDPMACVDGCFDPTIPRRKQARALDCCARKAFYRMVGHNPQQQISLTRQACYGLLLLASLSSFSICSARADTFFSILVMGVTFDGHDDAQLAESLSGHLIRNGQAVIPSRHLGPEEKRATAQEVLEQLARREKAQLLLSASVTVNGRDDYVEINLYDATRHRAVPIIKDLCQPAELKLCMAELVDKSIHQALDKSFPPAGDGLTAGTALATASPDGLKNTALVAPPSQTPIANPAATSAGHPLSTRRKVIAGVAGGLAVVSLATAIALTVLDGTAKDGLCSYQGGPMVPRCIWDTRAGYAVGYAATAGLVGGLVLTLLLPDTSKK